MFTTHSIITVMTKECFLFLFLNVTEKQKEQKTNVICMSLVHILIMGKKRSLELLTCRSIQSRDAQRITKSGGHWSPRRLRVKLDMADSRKNRHRPKTYIRMTVYKYIYYMLGFIVQELCESRGGRPGLSVLTSLLVSVDVKNY